MSALVYVLFAVLFVGVQILLASVDDEPPGSAAADREKHELYVPRARSQPDDQLAATSGADLTLGDLPRIAE